MKKVYIVEIHDVLVKTEKAVLVAIDHHQYWIPNTIGKIQSKRTSKATDNRIYRLILPTWYTGDILAKAHNGDYINNVIITVAE